MITLLFGWDYQWLGEFVFEEGIAERMTWTKEGTRRYAEVANIWQTQGIKTSILLTEQTPQGEARHWCEAFTLLRDREAESAFTSWANDAGNMVVALPERLLPRWEKLCSLDLEPQERYASLQALRAAPHRILEAWDKALAAVT